MHRKLTRVTLLGLFAAALTHCGSDDLQPIEDPEGAGEVTVGGKADGEGYGLTSCEADKLLAFVNSCQATNGALEAPPYKLSANAREGFFGVAQLADDTTRDDCGGTAPAFADLLALDGIKFIGKKTIERMGKAFGAACANSAALRADVIFSPQSYAQSHLPAIVKLIDGAKHSIDIAIYSFSDAKISAALEQAHDRGVKIRFIFEKARADQLVPLAQRGGTASARIEKLGINVRYVTKSKVMHHKFMIVDGPTTDVAAADSGTLITGSGNWNNGGATQLDENTVILRGVPEALLQFQHQFNTLWKQSLDFVWDANLPFEQTLALDPATFPDDPALEVLFTSANFKTSSPTFTRVRPNYTVADRLAAEIGKADDYVYIASGHLRSRRVFEALVARKTAKPALDVRVYLDGQEYISAWYDGQLAIKLSNCLAKATTEGQKQDCQDSGRYFSYQLATANTDSDPEPDIDLRFKYYAYRWDHSYAPQMHNKYVLIDDKTLISGSYNLSHNSEVESFENTIIYRATKPQFAALIAKFKKSFLEIWSTDADDSLLNALIDDVKEASRIPLVFAPMALDYDQVTELKDLIEANCPAAKSVSQGGDPDYSANPSAHRWCPRQ